MQEKEIIRILDRQIKREKFYRLAILTSALSIIVLLIYSFRDYRVFNIQDMKNTISNYEKIKEYQPTSNREEDFKDIVLHQTPLLLCAVWASRIMVICLLAIAITLISSFLKIIKLRRYLDQMEK